MTTLPFDVVVNDSKAKGKFKGLGDEAEGAGKKIEGSGKMSEVGLAAIGIAAVAVAGKVKDSVSQSITAASDLGESMNAVGKVFGANAGQITQWGEKNAASFGLSKRAFNEMATPLGAMLKNAGLSLQDTSKWTIDLTKRSSDMASVFNTDVSEALEAIQAGLRGESDPLEKFGVGLSAAKVEAKALAMTGKTVASSLTDQEKMMGRLAIIMEQTNDVQGDFADTSGGVANGARISAAEAENLQAQLGEKLLPAVQAVTQAKLALIGTVADVVQGFSELPGPLQAVYGGLGAVATVGPLAAAGIGKAKELASGAIEKFRGLGTAGKFAAAGVGVAGGAFVVATAALLYFAGKQAESKARVDALTESLDQQSGRITALTRKQIYLAAQEAGVAKEAAKAGVNQRQLLDAIIAGGPGLDAVIDRYGDYRMSLVNSGEEAQGAGARVDWFTRQVTGQTGELGKSVEKWKQQKEAGVAGAEGQEKAGAAVKDTTAAIKEQIEPTKTLTERWREAAGLFLDGRDAQRRLEEAIDDVNAKQKENGETLDENTEKGRANAESLDNLAQAHMDVLTAAEKEGESEATLIALRGQSATALYNEGRQFGLTREQAIAYTTKVLGIPKKAVTEALLKKEQAEDQIRDLEKKLGTKGLTRKRRADLTAQLARARAVRAEIDRLTMPRNLLIYTYRVESSSRRRGRQDDFAAGGLIGGMADGGYHGKVTGPGHGTSDTAGLFALSNGEYVIKAAAVEKYGVAVMDAMNNMRIEPVRRGGIAAGEPASTPWMNKRGGEQAVRLELDVTGGDEDLRRLIRKWIRNNNLLQGAA